MAGPDPDVVMIALEDILVETDEEVPPIVPPDDDEINFEEDHDY